MTKIPKILHFCFGLAENFGGQPWSLVHYVCVRSAVERIKPEQAFIYYEYEPSGVWWEKIRKFVTLVKIEAPREIFGNPLLHPAHRADVVRLEKLIEHGGIYLDTDVLVHRDFDELLVHSAVLGAEGRDGSYGLANAVILAEPQAPFLKRWYEEYRSFRSKGRDRYWNEHSVRLPLELSKKHPEELTILDHKAFFWPLWISEHLRWIFATPARPEERSIFANHLWESHAWERYLEYQTPGDIRRYDTNFHLWARPFVADLPDDFGKVNNWKRLARFVRLNRNRAKSYLAYRRYLLGEARRNAERRVYNRVFATPTFNWLASLAFQRWHRRKVFQHVYKSGLWGQEADSAFFSGIGSRGEAASIYVENMSKILNDYARSAGHKITVVDLGCGDFEIGRRLVERAPEINYVGCDIVPELIARHQDSHTSDRVAFKVVDFVSDSIPDGDICLVRQVLQHLQNSDILHAVEKLSKFKKVFITEGYPLVEQGPINPDKPISHEVRFDWRKGIGRGVELDKDPYNLSTLELFRAMAGPGSKEIVKTFEVLSKQRMSA